MFHLGGNSAKFIREKFDPFRELCINSLRYHKHRFVSVHEYRRFIGYANNWYISHIDCIK